MPQPCRRASSVPICRSADRSPAHRAEHPGRDMANRTGMCYAYPKACSWLFLNGGLEAGVAGPAEGSGRERSGTATEAFVKALGQEMVRVLTRAPEPALCRRGDFTSRCAYEPAARYRLVSSASFTETHAGMNRRLSAESNGLRTPLIMTGSRPRIPPARSAHLIPGRNATNRSGNRVPSAQSRSAPSGSCRHRSGSPHMMDA
jgi:hypothetical protein